jgi:hypothetical protein
MNGGLLEVAWSTPADRKGGHRASLAALLDVFQPAFLEIDDPDLSESAHVLRCADGSAHLHVFGRRPVIEVIAREADHTFNVLDVAVRVDTAPPLAAPSAEAYRRALALMSRVALDVLSGAERAETQAEIVAVGCRRRDDEEALGALLEAYSPTFALLSDPDVFWTLFRRRSPDGSRDAGHLLYTLVVGMDGFEGARVGAVLRAAAIDPRR